MQTSNNQKVIAAIIQRDGKYLIAQRAKEDALKGKWEFPGGKVEAGETFEECLKRELNEELGIIAEIGQYVCSSFFEHKGKQWEMLAYRVNHFSGTIELREHSAVHWVTVDEFKDYAFPEPDLPIIEILGSQLL